MQLANVVVCYLPSIDNMSRWTGGASTRCRVPQVLSQHGSKNKKGLPKAERGIGKYDSLHVLRKTGVFIQCGSGKELLSGFDAYIV